MEYLSIWQSINNIDFNYPKFGVIEKEAGQQTYFELGRRIVEYEQESEAYSNYEDFTLERLSRELTDEFGKGYLKRNLELVRKFYLPYKIAKTVFSQSISWTHYLHLLRITNFNMSSRWDLKVKRTFFIPMFHPYGI